MTIKRTETYNGELTFHGIGEIFVGFYDKKGTGHIIPLYSELLQPYFLFRGVRYNLNEKHIEQLNKQYQWTVRSVI